MLDFLGANSVLHRVFVPIDRVAERLQACRGVLPQPQRHDGVRDPVTLEHRQAVVGRVAFGLEVAGPQQVRRQGDQPSQAFRVTQRALDRDRAAL